MVKTTDQSRPEPTAAYQAARATMARLNKESPTKTGKWLHAYTEQIPTDPSREIEKRAELNAGMKVEAE